MAEKVEAVLPPSGTTEAGHGEHESLESSEGPEFSHPPAADAVLFKYSETVETNHEQCDNNGGITGCAFSPNGKWLATCSRDKTVRLISPRTRTHASRVERVIETGHMDWIYSITFSADGRSIATCSKDDTVRLIVVETGEVREIFNARTANDGFNIAEFSDVTYHVDGETLAISVTSDKSKKVRLISSKTGEQKDEFDMNDDLQIAKLLFNQEGRVGLRFVDLLITGGSNHEVRLIDITTGETEWTYNTGSPVRCIAINLDGRLIAAGCEDSGELRIINFRFGTLERLIQTPIVRTKVSAVAFNDDGNTVAFSNDVEYAVALCNVHSGELERIIDMSGVPPNHLSWSPDGFTLAIASSKPRTVRLVDIGVEEVISKFETKVPIQSVAYSPDGKTLATGRHDKSASVSVQLFDAKTFKLKWEVCGIGAINSIVFNPNGSTIVAAGDQKVIYSISVRSGDVERKADEVHTSYIWGIVYSPDGLTLATLCPQDKEGLRIFDAVTWQTKAVLKTGRTPHWGLAISADGSTLATCGGDVRLFNMMSGTEMGVIESGEMENHKSVAFSPDGSSVLATGSVKGIVRIINTKAKVVMRVIETHHSKEIKNITFAPKGESIITFGGEGRIMVFGVETGTLQRAFEPGHKDFMSCFAFSPDRSSLVTGSQGRGLVSVLSWDDSVLLEQPSQATAIKMINDELPLAVGDDYKWPFFESVVNRFPHMLSELRSDTSLVEHAVQQDRADFLRHFLLDTNGGANSQDVSIAAVRRNTAAVLVHGMRQSEVYPSKCLSTAIQKKSWTCLGVLFDVVAAGFSPEAVKPQNPVEITYGAEVTDMLREDVLSLAFETFPDLASSFLLKLGTIAAHPLVAEGCSKFNLEGGIKIEGSSIRSPPKFWKGLDDDDPSKRSGQPVEARLVPIKGAAGHRSKLLQSIVGACGEFAARGVPPYSTFQSPIVEHMIDFKWNTYAESFFLRDLALSICYAAVYTAQAISSYEDVQWGAAVALGFTAVLWFYFVYHEFVSTFGGDNCDEIHIHMLCTNQGRAMLSKLFFGETLWDRLQRMSLVAVGYTTVLNSAHDFERSAVAAAFGLPLVYMNLLYFMQGFQKTGVLVRMVVQITINIGWFVVILLVVLAGFSLSFFVLYRSGSGIVELPTVGPYEVEDNPYGYDHWWTSFLPGFTLMLGDFDVQEFESSGDKNAMAFLFTVFQFFVNIIMLNLLIAIMGDQYDIVQDSGHEQYLYAKAEIILEYERRIHFEKRALRLCACECDDYLYIPSPDTERFPEWLQILQPKTSGSNAPKGELSITGRVKKHVSAESRVLSDQIAGVNGATNELERKILAALNAQMAAIEGKLDSKLESFMEGYKS